MQVLDTSTWPAAESTSAGYFPIAFYVTRKFGTWLHTNADSNSPNVSAAFIGVPQFERVTWHGEYQYGLNEQGERVLFYWVEWQFNGHSYSGWIQQDYMSPKLVKIDAFSPRIYGDWGSPTFGYQGGREPWAAFATDGAAQYLNLYALFKSMGFPEEFYRDLPTRHTNLCGELAVMQALGVSLEEGFARFAALGDSFEAILANKDMGTNDDELRRFINAFSDYGWRGESLQSSSEDVQTRIASGKKVIALVTIDLNQDGIVSGIGTTDHWVEIREVNFMTDEIAYYNPYTNQVESVSKADFEAAWLNASGGHSQTIVAAYK
jgi:hypothetical protein